MFDEKYEDLASGIVQQACRDYLYLRAKFIFPSSDCNEKELEQFFRSEWFMVLCKISGEEVIKTLRERADNLELIFVPVKQGKRYYVANIKDLSTPVSHLFKTQFDCRGECAKRQGIDREIYKALLKREEYRV